MIVGQLPTTAAGARADSVAAHQVGSRGQPGQRGEHDAPGRPARSSPPLAAPQVLRRGETRSRHPRRSAARAPATSAGPCDPTAADPAINNPNPVAKAWVPGLRERGHCYRRTRARTRRRRSGTRSIDCSRLRSAGQDTMSTPMVAMSRYIADRCSAHIRSTSGSCSPSNGDDPEHVDRDHDVAAFAQVDQRQREFGVEQRGERDDDRARRERPRAAPRCPWWFRIRSPAPSTVSSTR